MFQWSILQVRQIIEINTPVQFPLVWVSWALPILLIVLNKIVIWVLDGPRKLIKAHA